MSGKRSWFARLFGLGQPLIDKSGEFWTSTDPKALDEYLIELTSEAFPATIFRHSVCVCGGNAFAVDYEPDEGVAKRICQACGHSHYLFDSEEYWPGDEDISVPMRQECPCKGSVFNICSGFATREGGADIRWVTIGSRCVACGILGAALDFKVDYSPSLHLFDQA